ncbi:MAG: amidohydrolase [Clostridia bacterium]|nr:amidohydrolase [Clostridia bacterium]
MKIIDVNATVGESLKYTRYQASDRLLAFMDDYRIAEAFTWSADCLRSPIEGNGRMMKEAAASEGRLRFVAYLDPSVPGMGLPEGKTLKERLIAARPAAVRINPVDGKYPFHVFYLQELLPTLEELRLPRIVDGGYDSLFWSNLPEVAKAYPKLPIILLRVGLNTSRVTMPLLKYTENVYFDMSIMLDVGQIEEITELGKVDRLLFASGLPTYEPSGSLANLFYAEISDADKEAIAHGNAERLLAGRQFD